MRPHIAVLVLVTVDAWLLGACGTSEVADGGVDSGVDVTDAVSDQSPFGDGGGADYVAPVVVYEGRDCGLPDVDTCHGTLWSCCNSAVCPGDCVSFGDAAPVCYCAGYMTGCPSPLLCCGSNDSCINQSQVDKCGTIGPPPDNCGG